MPRVVFDLIVGLRRIFDDGGHGERLANHCFQHSYVDTGGIAREMDLLDGIARATPIDRLARKVRLGYIVNKFVPVVLSPRMTMRWRHLSRVIAMVAVDVAT